MQKKNAKKAYGPHIMGCINILCNNYKKTGVCYAQEKLIKDLFSWQKGDINGKIEVKKGEYGWGLYTTDDLEEEETVIHIPREHQINVEDAVQGLVQKILF